MEVIFMDKIKSLALGLVLVVAFGASGQAALRSVVTKHGQTYYYEGGRRISADRWSHLQTSAAAAVEGDEEEGFAESMEADASPSAATSAEVSWPSVGGFAFGGSGFGADIARAALPGKTKISKKDIETFVSETRGQFSQVEGRTAAAGQFRDFLNEIKTTLEAELGVEYFAVPRNARTNAVALYGAVNGLLQSVNDIIALQPAPVSAFSPAPDHVAINIDVVAADGETDVRAQSPVRESWRSWAYRHRWKIVAGVVVSVAVVGTVAYIVTSGDVAGALEALQARIMSVGREAWSNMQALGGGIADFTRRVMGGIRMEDVEAAHGRIAELTRQLEGAHAQVRDLTAQAAELPALRGAIGDLTAQVTGLTGQLTEAQGALRMAQAAAEEAARRAAEEAARRAAEEAARLAAQAVFRAPDAWTVRATHEATGLWQAFREGGFSGATQRINGWF